MCLDRAKLIETLCPQYTHTHSVHTHSFMHTGSHAKAVAYVHTEGHHHRHTNSVTNTHIFTSTHTYTQALNATSAPPPARRQWMCRVSSSRGSFPGLMLPRVALTASMCLSPHLFIHTAGIMLRLPAHLWQLIPRTASG